MLLRVARPARYLDGEPNAVHKDHATTPVKFALAYPDVYEVGMSNLGLRLLYHVLNARSDTLCERVFAPWTDMEGEMRRLGVRLFALESGLPVAGFDFFGFSLQYELTYTNILNMLDLAGLPLLAADRGDDAPLVIGGGPCAFNPEPLAPFFDLFFIGEAEEGILDLIDAFVGWKKRAGGCRGPEADAGCQPGKLAGFRTALLEELARVPGVYVPAFYDVTYKPDGTVSEIRPNRTAAPPRVTKRVVADLDQHPAPPTPVVPLTETVHDRAVVEVMRGCARGCRFCQAGMIYRPVRERGREETLAAARAILANTGYEELSLTSLSTCDWGPVADALRELVAEHGSRGVAISLPSLRTDTFAVELASKIQEVRKTGLTFAPEAGTARLRAVVNKGVTREDLLSASAAAFAAGWDRLKLYYMVGLPTETDEDLAGIAEEAAEVLRVYGGRGSGNMAARRPLALTISLATFNPKAHTPFQWEAQVTVAEANRRLGLVRTALAAVDNRSGRSRRRRWSGIKVDWHSPEMSRIEAVIARGDRRLHAAILEAWRLGARFDGWSEFFRPDLWERAFAATGLDPWFYANRERPDDEVFPWEHLSSGVEGRFLARERTKALAAEPTPDCRWNPCTGCGVCDLTGVESGPTRLSAEGTGARPDGARREAGAGTGPAAGPGPRDSRPRAGTPPVRWRLRICYAKTGRPRFISHLDFVRLFERAAGRAGLPLAYSEGYSPAPRIAYGWPLQVGLTGLAEYLDVELTERVPPEKVVESLNQALPDGIEVRDARYVMPHGPSLMAEFNTGSYVAHCPARGRSLGEWREAAARLLARPHLDLVRERGTVGAGQSAGPAAGQGGAAGGWTEDGPGGAPGGRPPERKSAPFGEVKRKVVDVRPLIRRLEVREVTPDDRVVVFMELALGEKGSGRPEEVMALLLDELPGATGEAPGGPPVAGARELPRPEGLTAVRLGLRHEN